MDRDPSLRAARVGQVDPAEAQAARDVAALIVELEQTLTPHERHLLHRLRLCAETLGAVRASSMWRHGQPMICRLDHRT